jgi:hypothetical protein
VGVSVGVGGRVGKGVMVGVGVNTMSRNSEAELHASKAKTPMMNVINAIGVEENL